MKWWNPASRLAAGKIYDANGTLLETALRQAGLAVVRAGISTDDPAELRSLLRSHAAAGGPHCHHRGSQQGRLRSGAAGHGRPGCARSATWPCSPAARRGSERSTACPSWGSRGTRSVASSPSRCSCGRSSAACSGSPSPRPAVHGPAPQPLTSPAGKHQVRRGTLLPDGTVRLEGGESSHLVRALARSNALVHVPEGVTALARGRRSGSMDVVTAENNNAELTHLRQRRHRPDGGRVGKTGNHAGSHGHARRSAARGKSWPCWAPAACPKGDALAVARVAGIMAAKKTPELIPLCHPLPISKVTVDFELGPETVEILATVKTRGVTGVEMEALTAASVAALSVYDMIKAVDKHAVLTDIKVLAKSGGKSGDWSTVSILAQLSQSRTSTARSRAGRPASSLPRRAPPPALPGRDRARHHRLAHRTRLRCRSRPWWFPTASPWAPRSARS